mgnify:CR=1 FL=1
MANHTQAAGKAGAANVARPRGAGWVLVLIALAAWVLKGYPLTPARHEQIRLALAARDGAAA